MARGGLPRLGAYGCGLASAIAMWLMFLVMLAYLLAAKRYQSLALFSRFEWPQRSQLLEWVRLGLPIGITIFMEVSLFSAIALIMGKLGMQIVAAHQIALNFAALMFMIPMGIAMAITVRVGQALGRGEPVIARQTGWIGIGVCLVFMVLSASGMILFPRAITSAYTDSAPVQQIAVALLGMAAMFQLFDGLQVASAGALRGYKDTHIPMWITLFAYWVIGVPLAWLLGIQWQLGPRAVWGGFIAGLSVAALFLTLRFWRIAQAQNTSPSHK